MTSSRAVGRCVRHRGHRDTEDTEEFRDFASTTLPTTDGRICCLAITAGAPRSGRGLFVFTLRDAGTEGMSAPSRLWWFERSPAGNAAFPPALKRAPATQERVAGRW